MKQLTKASDDVVHLVHSCIGLYGIFFFSCSDILFPCFQSDTSQVDKDIKWADAFLVVYSITDKNSFNNAIHLVEAIYDGKGTDELHVALVGNKIDLEHFRKGKKADVLKKTPQTNSPSGSKTETLKEIRQL